MVCLVARQGRELQRYTSGGGRLVVGCIPYKFRDDKPFDIDVEETVEVLVITSQKGHGMMFPKGGWEIDENIDEAVLREALEEAGVQGDVEARLGNWRYRSRRYDQIYEGVMFPLNVTKELLQWPEMAVRKRKWVTVAEAREGCQHLWMREALDRLVSRLSNSCRQKTILA
ncbi:nudix hydrolase 17, mitochondrial-like [Typha angustifolia]|uniref:nudix hydrolase 17, mitochondrial-like n=1 Tax=Typha angustifolia TaxID=59011 RepID=UPI003C2BEB58